MRNLGLLLLAGGVLGYVYFSDQGSEGGRYAAAFAGVLGVVLSLYPKGR